MKIRYFFLLLFCTVAFAAEAQTTDTTKVFGKLSQYNHWTIGANVGVTNDLINFTNNATTHFKPQLGYGLSLRDQLSHFFSLSVNYNGGDVKGDNVQNGVDASKYGSLAFRTSFNMGTLNAILDFGSVSFLHRQNAIDFYGSAGWGYTWYRPKYDPTALGLPASGYNLDYGKTVVGLVAPIGVGIKFKLSDKLGLDVGYNVNLINEHNFQGLVNYPTFDRYSYSYAGLEYTFGSASKKNIEWVNPIATIYDALYDQALRQEVAALKGRVANVEQDAANLKKDSDGDGVSDLLDKCPGTPAGTPVDGSGCPLPKIDSAAVCAYCKAKTATATAPAAPTDLILFDSGSSDLGGNTAALDGIISGMKSDKTLVLHLTGRSSSAEFGGTASGSKYLQLSTARVKAVVSYLTKSGISAKRIKTKSLGKNPPSYNHDDFHAAAQELNRSVQYSF